MPTELYREPCCCECHADGSEDCDVWRGTEGIADGTPKGCCREAKKGMDAIADAVRAVRLLRNEVTIKLSQLADRIEAGE